MGWSILPLPCIADTNILMKVRALKSKSLQLPQLNIGFWWPLPRVFGFALEMGKSCEHFSKVKVPLYLKQHFPLPLRVIPENSCMSFTLVLSSPSLSQVGRIFPLFLVRQFYSNIQRVSQSCSCIWETNFKTSWQISVSSNFSSFGHEQKIISKKAYVSWHSSQINLQDMDLSSQLMMRPKFSPTHC